MLWNMAGELKMERKVTKLEQTYRFLKPALQIVEKQLFRFPFQQQDLFHYQRLFLAHSGQMPLAM